MKRLLPSVVLLLAVVAAGCAPAPDGTRRDAEPPPLKAGAPAEAIEPQENPPAAPPQVDHSAGRVEPEPVPPSSSDQPAEAEPPPVDPLQQIRNEQIQREDRRLALERAKDRVTAAQAEIATLEKRLLAVRNPFLPRPQLPPEEAKAWEGLGGAERVKRVEGQLAAAKVELEAALASYLALGGRRE